MLWIFSAFDFVMKECKIFVYNVIGFYPFNNDQLIADVLYCFQNVSKALVFFFFTLLKGK